MSDDTRDDIRSRVLRGIGALSVDVRNTASPLAKVSLHKIAVRASGANVRFHPKGETKAMRDAARAAKRAAAAGKADTTTSEPTSAPPSHRRRKVDSTP